eukprot:jgi/Chlat1/1736/Chrsp13S02166
MTAAVEVAAAAPAAKLPAGASPELLGTFWGLASLDPAVRQASSRELVRVVGASGDKAAARYALRRLLKGLASSRDGARQGFASALASLLASAPAASLSADLPKEVAAALELSGGGGGGPSARSRKDVREVLLGRVLAYGAAAQAGPGKLGPSSSAVLAAARDLLAAAERSSGLREAACCVLLRLHQARPLSREDAKTLFSEQPLASWCGGEKPTRPEALLLVLGGLAKSLQAAAAGFAAPQWVQALASEPLQALADKDMLGRLKNVLLDSSSAHPRMHAVWMVLLSVSSAGQCTLPTKAGEVVTPSKEAIDAFLPGLWQEVVDDGLLASSPERKHLAYSLFQLILPHLTPQQLMCCLSEQFVHDVATHARSTASPLHPAASQVCNLLQTQCASLGNGDRVAALLRLSQFTGGAFDRMTNTRTVATLHGLLSPDELELYRSALLQLFNTSMDTQADEPADGLATWVVNELCNLLKHPSLSEETNQQAALQFLAAHALLNVSSEDSPDGLQSVKASARLQQLCAARLASVLSAPADQVAARRITDLLGFLERTLKLSGVELRRPAEEELQQSLQSLTNNLQSEEAKATSDSQSRLTVLRVFVMRVHLQYLLEPETYAQAAQELPLCIPHLLNDTKPEADAPSAIDVFVDLLISLLSTPNAPLRDIVEQVFKAWCFKLSETAVEDMLRVAKLQMTSTQQSVLNLKLRVLSLLDVFLHRHPTNLLVLRIVPALLRTASALHDVASAGVIVEKIVGMLQRLAKSKDHPKTLDLPVSLAAEALRQALLISAANKRVANAAMACSHFLVRVLQGSGQTAVVCDTYGKVLHDALERKALKLPVALLLDSFSRHTYLVPALVPKLIHLGSAAKTEFLRCEVLALLAKVLRHNNVETNACIGAQAVPLMLLLQSAMPKELSKPARKADALQLCCVALQGLQRVQKVLLAEDNTALIQAVQSSQIATQAECSSRIRSLQRQALSLLGVKDAAKAATQHTGKRQADPEKKQQLNQPQVSKRKASTAKKVTSKRQTMSAVGKELKPQQSKRLKIPLHLWGSAAVQ